MRLFLLVSATAVGALATTSPLSTTSPLDGGTSLRRHWGGDHEQSHHWWDRYSGHEDEDDYGHDGHDKWRHEDHDGDKNPWGHGRDEGRHGHKYSDNGWYGRGHYGVDHDEGKWGEHGREGKSGYGDWPSHPSDRDGNHGHGEYEGTGKHEGHGADGKYGHGGKYGGEGKHSGDDHYPGEHSNDDHGRWPKHESDGTWEGDHDDDGKTGGEDEHDRGHDKYTPHRKHGDSDRWNKPGHHEGGDEDERSERHGHGRYSPRGEPGESHGGRKPQDEDDEDERSGRGGHGEYNPHGESHRGKEHHSHKGNDEDERGDASNPSDVPVTSIPVTQRLRRDTETFVSEALGWVNDIIGEDEASTLVIDTTFSLTKNEFADLSRGPCGSTTLVNIFPVLLKFIRNPQDINLLDEDVGRIAWKASPACTSGDAPTEVEGGVYASFEVLCGEASLLNVSIASSGSTPTVQGQATEDSSFYIDVNVLNGQLRASDAKGTIIGVLENRHYPENAAIIQKNWTAALKQCGAAHQLSVVGVVGGGWTTYTQRDSGSNHSDPYQVAAVGYTESFIFSFPETDDPMEPKAPSSVPAPASGSPDATVVVEASAGAIAASGASAYVQTGVICRHHVGAPKVCAGHAVMSQLTSFFQSGPAANGFQPVLRSMHGGASVASVSMEVVGLLVVAIIGVVVVTTMRRRSGYRLLEIPSQA